MSTFSQLDKNNAAKGQMDSGLGKWYESVKNVPIEELTIDDLARALRQKVHLQSVVPIVLETLEKDPLAGHQYEGELISALSRVPSELWNHQPSLFLRATAIVKRSRHLFDREVREELDKFMQEKGQPPKKQE
jgi:hypothetical protein